MNENRRGAKRSNFIFEEVPQEAPENFAPLSVFTIMWMGTSVRAYVCFIIKCKQMRLWHTYKIADENIAIICYPSNSNQISMDDKRRDDDNDMPVPLTQCFIEKELFVLVCIFIQKSSVPLLLCLKLGFALLLWFLE